MTWASSPCVTCECGWNSRFSESLRPAHGLEARVTGNCLTSLPKPAPLLHYESRRAATNTNNSFAPSYVSLDAGLRYATSVMERHHAALRLQFLNATDKHYYASIADGNIVGSPGANTAYLAAPRTFMANLEFDY